MSLQGPVCALTRGALEVLAERYVRALVSNDPSDLPTTDHVVYPDDWEIDVEPFPSAIAAHSRTTGGGGRRDYGAHRRHQTRRDVSMGVQVTIRPPRAPHLVLGCSAFHCPAPHRCAAVGSAVELGGA